MGKFFESFESSNGSMITVEWTVGSFVLGRIIGFLAVVIFFCWAIAFVPIAWFFIYFVSPQRNRYGLNITGILGAIFYLCDYHFGMLGAPVLQAFFTPVFTHCIAKLEVAFILVHLGLLLFDKKIYIYYINKGESDYDVVKRLFGYSMSAVIIIYMLFSNLIVDGFISQSILDVYKPDYK